MTTENTDQAIESLADVLGPQQAATEQPEQLNAPKDLLDAELDEATASSAINDIDEVPATAYDYQLFDTLQGEAIDNEFLSAMAGEMHGLGLSTKQAQNLAVAYQKELKKFIAGTKERQQAEFKELKSSWGRDAQKYTAQAQMAARRFGFSHQELAALEEAFGPKFMLEKLSHIGSSLAEDNPVLGTTGQNDFSLNPEGAKSRMEELLNDPLFSRRYLAGEKDALHKIAQLSRLAS